MRLNLSFIIQQTESPGVCEVSVFRSYSSTERSLLELFLGLCLALGLIGGGWLPPEILLVLVPAVFLISIFQSVAGPRAHNALASRGVAIIAGALKDRVVASIEEGERDLGQLSVPDTSDEIRGAVSSVAERGELSPPSLPRHTETQNRARAGHQPRD